jgi:hypothetical protein
MVPISGNRIICGGNKLVQNAMQEALSDDTPVNMIKRAAAGFCPPPMSGGGSAKPGGITIGEPPEGFIEKLQVLGFKHKEEETIVAGEPVTMPRSTYARTFGPTVGDRVRLGDTDLVIEVEKDLCSGLKGRNYGEEVKFGGGMYNFYCSTISIKHSRYVQL